MRGRWRPTPALARAVVVAAIAVVAAVVSASPAVLLLGAPFVLLATLGLLHRPDSSPTVEATLDHRWLHEGQGTTSRLRIVAAADVEHVARAMAPTPYVALHPPNGLVAGLVAGADDAPPEIEVGPRRWGRRVLGQEQVCLTTPWAGYRWGPVSLPGDSVRVLPHMRQFASRAETPRPVGLVGVNRSPRLGAGVEFADIRPFRPGDRLRRISWRVSVRSRELHVTTSPSEEDSGVLLVLDALGDHGHSGGLDGEASSLDQSVRAAAAVAEHHVGAGDRVGLRIVGGDGGLVGYGAGTRHLRVLLDQLAGVQPRELPEGVVERLQLRVTGGSVVLVFSPMLDPAIVTATAGLVQRALPVVVIDTLPPGATPRVPDGVDPRIADLAWRMRRLERDQVLVQLAALGCPVIPWRGAGTLDDVLRRLARRATVPQVALR
ncbi:MAG TPA: DUF58 domain-containing protein [Nocardioides bacterium]|uniref:DUF58 domain-containing protein n=1 Tax=uncultured Nocardioides sp. TaxID=198441 RepID=UPI000EB91AEC|nr:DUF58 domain-containing protein [uncultured Nocardioides sp.]HCB04710.1 DUF58 domain-containing protein [Nocardioides sp.]